MTHPHQLGYVVVGIERRNGSNYALWSPPDEVAFEDAQLAVAEAELLISRLPFRRSEHRDACLNSVRHLRAGLTRSLPTEERKAT